MVLHVNYVHVGDLAVNIDKITAKGLEQSDISYVTMIFIKVIYKADFDCRC